MIVAIRSSYFPSGLLRLYAIYNWLPKRYCNVLFIVAANFCMHLVFVSAVAHNFVIGIRILQAVRFYILL